MSAKRWVAMMIAPSTKENDRLAIQSITFADTITIHRINIVNAVTVNCKNKHAKTQCPKHLGSLSKTQCTKHLGSLSV